LQIEAREVGPKTSLSSSAQITVYISDQNDNPPVFRSNIYRAELTENVTAGTRFIQVRITVQDNKYLIVIWQ